MIIIHAHLGTLDRVECDELEHALQREYGGKHEHGVLAEGLVPSTLWVVQRRHLNFPAERSGKTERTVKGK